MIKVSFAVLVLFFAGIASLTVSTPVWGSDEHLTKGLLLFSPIDTPTVDDLVDQEMMRHDHSKYNWYDKDNCCDNSHCRPVDSKYVTEHPDGSVTVQYGVFKLEFSADMRMRRPPDAPPDPYWHPCFEEGNLSGGDKFDFKLYCIYPMDSSS